MQRTISVSRPALESISAWTLTPVVKKSGTISHRISKGVKQAFAEESGNTSGYRIGAYGSGIVCQTLTDAGLIELTWLAMSRGFKGTREALAARKFHLAQRAPEATL